MLPQEILIKEYTYHLPEERIAIHPLPERDRSKLLVYKSGKIDEHTYAQLADCLPADSLLVFNNTKVMAVRLHFTKHTGSTIELFCLEPADDYPDITTAMLQKGKVLWKCLVGGAKKWKEERLSCSKENMILTAKKVKQEKDYFIIEFEWNDTTLSFADVLQLLGTIPLPPYLNRVAEQEDEERYQTIYAKYNGSVAAPTAGLHFTENLFEKLQARGIQKDFVTLHVGAGTFKPVKTESIAEHDMHAEFIEVSTAFIEHLIQYLPKTIVAVGTTSLRTIESLYWMGVKVIGNENILAENISVMQWEAYHLPQDITPADALQSLLNWMKKMQIEKLITKTKILIAPGYQLRIAKALITNFHQPQSTLLLLIAAIVGDDWKRIYAYALANDFRFLSYGDGSLLWKREE
ncbi:S-adenosylmethionine:tRNA ribosyltransferase-isomerase [Ilyomonas limi]|uniref:S-adenosylmethionine:tRNA ribosyltransferase-isomerase n=2 Tax=Ilyomonas limi TaxID=2575867 RepID=A0A4U3KSH9_9BACT|nr:S-adenosylmethionine:tRNA ribosyltransferase-isomerase [Ilyomonas limi]